MLKPDVPTVLARFSRQRAACLSFTSYNVANNTLEHRRNTRDDGTMRSMAQVLKEVFPGYLLAEVRVDDAAARAITTAKYVTSVRENSEIYCG